LLALTLWIGAIFFFSIGVAPVAFRIFPSQEAGEMVRGSLRTLHVLGLVCGLLFLVTSLMVGRFRRFNVVLVLSMMLLTGISRWVITPKIEKLRQSRDIKSERFSRLHSASTGLEGAVLLMGCIAIWNASKSRAD
jgi:hypothetical protein